MPFMSKAQLQRMVFMCGASLPSAVIKRVAKYDADEDVRRAGVEYAAGQLVELAQAGARGLHIYGMNRIEVVEALMGALRSAGFAGGAR
jgi:methylenetetrahydrofolate reductase (NADPH)